MTPEGFANLKGLEYLHQKIDEVIKHGEQAIKNIDAALVATKKLQEIEERNQDELARLKKRIQQLETGGCNECRGDSKEANLPIPREIYRQMHIQNQHGTEEEKQK